ncbi:CAAX prenyl protease family protein [Entamoeba histolytica HM-3:IMSS]|uniref:intramembrane prenyl-peptidase Rce1 n=5 Tax=Entamoeba histolytica TaxID=5759 RepID=C4LVT7_ENTH1|nr:CAAX prenyl protease family [Entamoeba histolytica HM-1:IMSS]EMD47818.1 CAAX prenyl protease family protein [Entamoeba histolytica KU27]EMS13377.1 CAAX prenyl protease family protein [Entamoeba histolytica HM-3:IMSS]ENY59930.1 CAAX prenyl protease family protein, putative [Entamoeba histolytica HM-1:IMSS-A]GAT92793.1 caax prenyl protease family [Entamoeba histolytica]EAL51068.2 CAAX prenyl protease family [Entamoeba histolytica HM-1:IMSS]|eukprot:XP_656466.2 CAAX prenyl protease family [Entamoeba histolytica HM-1:IMSS]
MIVVGWFMSIIITLTLTVILLAFLGIASHRINDENKIAIIRMIIGIGYCVFVTIILDVPLNFNIPVLSTLFHLTQIVILFIGFIYCVYQQTDQIYCPNSLFIIRALVVAPIIEETLFRGVFIPYLLTNGCTSIFTFIYCSMLFGLAHINHLITEDVIDKAAIINTMIQVGFTTLFGMYSSYVFFSTKSVISCILCHAVANYLGFPDFTTMSDKKTAIIYIIGITLFIGSFFIHGILF